MNESVIKHQFKGPFIPLAVAKKRVKKQAPKKTYLVCKKDKKHLQFFNINKGQIIEVTDTRTNMIMFFDESIKKNRHISLPQKLMKHFKELD